MEKLQPEDAAGARGDLEPLVSADWLVRELGAPDLRVIDASWHLPTSGRDARAEFERQHIPGAVFFDIGAIADRTTSLPHMLPTAAAFAAAAGALGVGNGDRVVVYDAQGLMSAARVWWTFRVFGCDRVAILDGGLAKWLAEGRPLARGPAMPRPRIFATELRPALVRSKAQMIANLETEAEQVLDARSAARFYGREPEPRPGLRGGHIPRSLNLPFEFLTGGDRTVLPIAALRRLYQEAGVDLRRPVVTTCGSGITACVLAFGLHLLGAERVAVYDGAWAEWGAAGETPVELL